MAARGQTPGTSHIFAPAALPDRPVPPSMQQSSPPQRTFVQLDRPYAGTVPEGVTLEHDHELACARQNASQKVTMARSKLTSRRASL